MAARLEENITVVHPDNDTFGPDWKLQGGVPIATRTVCLSRTDPHGSPTVDEPVREIEAQHREGILSAERLIYVETQYFSSRAMGEALCQRLRAGGPAVQVVLVLNMKAETLKEQIAVGLAQAKNIADVRAAAEGTPHRLGIYYTVPDCDSGEPDRATYVHSKVMVVATDESTSARPTSQPHLTWTPSSTHPSRPIDAGDALGRASAVCASAALRALGVDGLDCDPDGLCRRCTPRATP